MTARLFCEHCEKFYEVDLKDIRLMQEQENQSLRFAHNTYFFNEGCFFKQLVRLKQTLAG